MKIRVACKMWRLSMEGRLSPSLAPLCSRVGSQSISNPAPSSFERLYGTDLYGPTLENRRDSFGIAGISALKYETRVMSFGDGSSGALGHHAEGYLTDVGSPEPIEGLPKNIVKVAAGHYHSLAVTEDGDVWAWGRNEEGQLGPRDGDSRQKWSQPKRVEGLERVRVKDVAGSGVVSMALADDGSLWSWGSSKRGQLGLTSHVVQAPYPQQVMALAEQKIAKMALGWGHALVCTTDGELYAWGYAADGRLGFDLAQASRQTYASPIAREAEDVADVQAHSVLDGNQLGEVWEPRRVDALVHKKVESVVCGMDHSLVLAESGELYSFGDNSLGQLGRPVSKQIVGLVELPGGKNQVIRCAAGLGHSLAIASSTESGIGEQAPAQPTTWEKETQGAARGSLFSWGWDSSHQLGRAGDPDLPGPVEGLKDERLVSVTAGRVHSVGLSSKRQIWVWGSGTNGRLGLDSPTDEHYPTPIEKLGFWRTLQVACGFDHSLLLVRTVACSSVGDAIAK